MYQIFYALIRSAPTIIRVAKGLIPVIKENFKSDPDKPKDLYDKLSKLIMAVLLFYWSSMYFFGEDITNLIVLTIESFSGQEVTCYGYVEVAEVLQDALEVMTLEKNELLFRVAELELQLQNTVPNEPDPVSPGYSGYLKRL